MLTIIGCVNLNRNDDAVGVIIAQRLQQYLAQNPHPNIRVFDCGRVGWVEVRKPNIYYCQNQDFQD